jgi:hypothetical protein
MTIFNLNELDEAASVLTGTLNERQRQHALESIAARPSSDGARLLVDLFYLTPWSPHRCAIVRTLGRFSDQRTVEFLYRSALSETDLTIAREAVLALGKVGTPLAQEILFSFAGREDFPFRREAVHAIGQATILTVGDELENLFQTLKSTIDWANPEGRLLETTLLVLAAHGWSTIDDDLIALMERAANASQLAESTGSNDLFHACLLAAGSLASPRVLSAIAQFNLNDQTFSASLKSAVLAQSDRHTRPNLESVLLDLAAAASSGRTLQIHRLTRFSIEELEEAQAILGEEIGYELSLWMEIALATKCRDQEQKNAAAKCERILEHAISHGKPHQIAISTKLARASRTTKQWRQFIKQLEFKAVALIGELVPDLAVSDQICQKISQNKFESDSEFTALCNALVAQVHMTAVAAVANSALKGLGVISLDKATAAGVRARAIRAMGQCGFCAHVTAEERTALAHHLEQIFLQNGTRAPVFQSFVHALGNAPSAATMRVIGQVTQAQIDAHALPGILDLLLTNLILFPPDLLESCELRFLGHEINTPSLRRLILRLFGLGAKISLQSSDAKNTSSHTLNKSVVESLSSNDFSEIVLALEAARHFDSISDWTHVFKLISSDHAAIRSLAMERVCRSRQASIQNQVVDCLRSDTRLEAELLLHCFDVFEIDPQDPPLAFAQFLKSASQEPRAGESQQQRDPFEGAFQRADVRQEATSLAEQIIFVAQNREQTPDDAVSQYSVNVTELRVHAREHDGNTTPMGRSNVLLEPSDRELVDSSLKKDLPLFDTYSEVLKSVLRNAELPFSHPQIFGDKVDKSTAIIELVKSIDLLLQERVGEPLFLGSRPEVLAKLRSRISRLGLHDIASDNNHTLRVLGIEHIFTAELFPSIKLAKLVQSILAGKFVSDQLRILDGLKGWAVFLVLFARPQRMGDSVLEPVLQVTQQPPDKVARLAWEMILLQERRNVAAHRGTIIDAADILGLRIQSVSVLATIDALFSSHRNVSRLRNSTDQALAANRAPIKRGA